MFILSSWATVSLIRRALRAELCSCHVRWVCCQITIGSITRAVESTPIVRRYAPPEKTRFCLRRRCAGSSLSVTFSAWVCRTKLGSSPNWSSLRDYRSILRYLPLLVPEYLYSPKHSCFCVFCKGSVSLWLMYWKLSVQLHTTVRPFLFLVILPNCKRFFPFTPLWLLASQSTN